MSVRRQLQSNIVYLPLKASQANTVGMSDMQGVGEKETIRWREYISAVALNRDKVAYQSLYLFFAPKIKSFFIKQGLSANAEELTHEVFLRVWSKSQSYQESKASVSTWIFTIARNLKIDFLRKKRVIEVYQEFESEVETDFDDELALTRTTKNIHTLFNQLNLEQKNVMQKVYFEDKSHTVVAKELGMTLGSVKSRVRSALKFLRCHIGDSEK